MGLWSRLLGQGDAPQPGAGSGENARTSTSGEGADASDRNWAYEAELKRDFGLEHGVGGWAFDGGAIIEEYASRLGSPEQCIATLKNVRKRLSFTEICVVAGRSTVLVCNHTTPVCLVTTLDRALVGQFIAAIMKQTNSPLHEYRGVWRLEAP